MKASEIAILVCGIESHFHDDVKSECVQCACPIFVRPYVDHIRIRLCGDCGRRMMYANGIPDNVEIPPRSIREVLEENKMSP